MELKYRFNTETDDVEIVVDDKILDTIGVDVVKSWVMAYNKKHGYVEQVEIEQKEVEEETSVTAETEESGTEEEVDISVQV